MLSEREAFLGPAAWLGRRPKDLLFIDDRQRNIDGAAAVGVEAILFEGADSLRAELEELKRLHSTLSRLFAELRIDLAGRARVLPGPIRTPAPQDRDSALEERGRGPLSRRGALSPSLRARLVTKTPPTAER